MTPAAHGTEAASLLAIVTAKGDTASPHRNALLAEVHAVLATKAGTGSNYATSEAELVVAATNGGTNANMARAKAFALLAT